MCTVSWRRETGGYDLFFSRDEQRTRAAALAPRTVAFAGARALTPVDPPGGGTWIMLNEHGLTACVINRYGQSAPARSRSTTNTRGRIPLSLAGARSVEDGGPIVQEVLASTHFKPFLLLLLAQAGGVAGWEWDGVNLTPRLYPHFGMTTSSSLAAERVVPAREAQFRTLSAAHAGGPSGDALREFHLAAGAPADAASVRMSRHDARTVSLTEVRVRPGLLEMAYAPRIRDDGFAPAVWASLACARAPSPT